jgi:N-acetylmuramoyl-L-alanine amidase
MPTKKTIKKIKFTIDPGHYKGYNAGVIRPYYEGEGMYKLGLYLKKELEKYEGFSATLTRGSIESNPSVEQRGRMAANNGSEVCISLHSDAFNTQSAIGVTILRSIKRPGSKSLVNKMGKAIATEMKKTTGITYFRGSIVRPYAPGMNLDWLGVLRESVKSPDVKHSFLIEHGFHSNKKECAYLMNDENLKSLAKVEAKVFAEYYGVELKAPTSTNTKTNTKTPPNKKPNTAKKPIVKYEVVANSIPGYKKSEDAASGYNKVSDVPKGNYFVFKKYNGIINITTKHGTPGWWINPKDNK